MTIARRIISLIWRRFRSSGAVRRRKARRHLANLLTLLGGTFAVAGVVTIKSWLALGVTLLVLSAMMDMLDGYLARKLQIVSTYGAGLDWSMDAAVAFYLLGATGAWWAVLPIVLMQAWALEHERKFSGRTLAAIGFVGVTIWGSVAASLLGWV